MFKHLMDYVFLYLAFCLTGAGLEWGYGILWNVVGTTPYIYPSSPLRFTSLEMLPHWGFGGFVAISVYTAIRDRSARKLLGAVVPLVLATLWILLYSQVLYPS